MGNFGKTPETEPRTQQITNFIDALLPGVVGEPNTTYKWFPMDNKDVFKGNLKKHPERLKELGWDKTKINYSLDSLGLRNNEDIQHGETYTLFLGCSFTFGIGVPVENTWPYYFMQELGCKGYNAGHPGYGIDANFRSLYYLTQKGYKFDRVVMLNTSDRIEIFDKKSNNWQIVAWWSEHKPELKKVLLHDNFCQLNELKTMNAIQNICTQHNIEFINANSIDTFEMHELINNCHSARDLQHPGPNTHKQLAEYFINLVV